MKWNLKHDGARAVLRRLENDCLRRRTAALLVWFLCCPVVVLLMIPVFAEDFARDEGGFKAGASALLAGVIYLTVSVNFKTGIGDAWARVAGTLPVSQRDRMRLVRRLALLPVVMWTFTSFLAALFFTWRGKPDQHDFLFIGSAIPFGLAAFAAAGLHHAARRCGGRSGTLEIVAFLSALAAGALTPHDALRLLIPAALCVLIAILVWRRMEYLDILPWWRDEFPPDNTTASQASKPEALRKPENVALVTGLWLLILIY